MRKLILIAFATALMVVPASKAEAALIVPTLNSYASLAPNVFGSPNWNAYLNNALIGIDNNGSAVGTPGTASYYESGLYFDPFMVTSFNSWMGDATPSAPFAGEYGNRIHFGLEIEWEQSLFSLSQVSYEATSSDPSNFLGMSGNFAGSNYSATRVGIYYGADKTRGTADDVIYNSGQSAAEQINLLLYVGVGNAPWPGDEAEMGTTSDYLLTNGGNPGPFIFQNKYSLIDSQGLNWGETTAQAIVEAPAAVPEPSTWALFGAGLVGLVFQVRRKRAAR